MECVRINGPCANGITGASDWPSPGTQPGGKAETGLNGNSPVPGQARVSGQTDARARAGQSGGKGRAERPERRAPSDLSGISGDGIGVDVVGSGGGGADRGGRVDVRGLEPKEVTKEVRGGCLGGEGDTARCGLKSDNGEVWQRAETAVTEAIRGTGDATEAHCLKSGNGEVWQRAETAVTEAVRSTDDPVEARCGLKTGGNDKVWLRGETAVTEAVQDTGDTTEAHCLKSGNGEVWFRGETAATEAVRGTGDPVSAHCLKSGNGEVWLRRETKAVRGTGDPVLAHCLKSGNGEVWLRGETEVVRGTGDPVSAHCLKSGNGEVWLIGETAATEAVRGVTEGMSGVSRAAEGEEASADGRSGSCDAGSDDDTATGNVTRQNRDSFKRRQARKTSLGDVARYQNRKDDEDVTDYGLSACTTTTTTTITTTTTQRGEENDSDVAEAHVDENRNLSSEPNGETDADLSTAGIHEADVTVSEQTREPTSNLSADLSTTGIHEADVTVSEQTRAPPTNDLSADLSTTGIHEADVKVSEQTRAPPTNNLSADLSTTGADVTVTEQAREPKSDSSDQRRPNPTRRKPCLSHSLDVSGLADLSQPHGGLSRRNTVGVSRSVDGKTGQRSINGCLWTQNGSRKGKLRKSVSFNIPRPRSPER